MRAKLLIWLLDKAVCGGRTVCYSYNGNGQHGRHEDLGISGPRSERKAMSEEAVYRTEGWIHTCVSQVVTSEDTGCNASNVIQE